jgi:quinol monooxygenase YgiN
MYNCKSLFGGVLIALSFLFSGVKSSAQDTRVMQLAKLEIDSAQLEPYSRFLKKGIETALRLEPGVLMLYAVADKAHPTHITILEIYADTAAYRAHLQTAHFLEYKKATADMVKHLELEPVTALMPGEKIK